MRYSIRNEYKVLAGEKLVPYKTLQNTPFEEKSVEHWHVYQLWV